MAGGRKPEEVSPEDKAFAELFLDLKGRKKKRLDWIAIANRCKFLADRHESLDALAEKLGVSVHLVRSIIKLLELPPEVQSMIKRGDILYDAAYRLHTLRDPKRKVAVATAMVGLPSHKQREMIQFARRFPKRSLASFRARLTQPSKPSKRLDAVLVVFDRETFDRLRAYSKKLGITVQEAVQRATRNVLSGPAQE
jgi:ParB-like chromosome segregation protein Spo0J